MLGGLSLAGGYPIYANRMMQEFENVPVKKHVKKGWMRESYHSRISKKWIKRYGTKEIRPTIVTGGRMYAHPNTVAAIIASTALSP